MRHRQRPMAYAVSTALGLIAPAAAALVLTSSTVTFAAPAPAPTPVVFHDDKAPLVVAPTTRPAPAKAVARPVVKKARPVAAPTRTRVARTVTAAPAVRRTGTTTTTTTTRTVSQTKQPWGKDDYPYRTQSDFYAIDRWGFTQRQCVSFAAWRLAQHGDTIRNDGNQWGSALTWDDAARKLGHTVTRKARVGAVAQWNAHEGSPYYAPGSAKANGTFSAGGYGHVGWVKQVYTDGSALVEQYNMGSNRSYSVMRVKAPRYLLIG